MAKVRCGFCKTFIPKEGSVPYGLSHFCDTDCLTNKRFEIKTPKKSIKKNVKKKTKQNKSLSDETRQEVLRRDGYKCRFCGTQEDLCIHHVVYKSDPKNKPWQDQRSNLLVLCNQICHLKKVHGNKKKYQRLCLQIIWLAEVLDDKPFRILLKA